MFARAFNGPRCRRKYTPHLRVKHEPDSSFPWFLSAHLFLAALSAPIAVVYGPVAAVVTAVANSCLQEMSLCRRRLPASFPGSRCSWCLIIACAIVSPPPPGPLIDLLVQMQLVTVEDVLTIMGDSSSLAEKGELEKLVEAVGRVFSTNDGTDYIPFPTGYSGEVNKVRGWCVLRETARASAASCMPAQTFCRFGGLWLTWFPTWCIGGKAYVPVGLNGVLFSYHKQNGFIGVGCGVGVLTADRTRSRGRLQ